MPQYFNTAVLGLVPVYHHDEYKRQFVVIKIYIHIYLLYVIKIGSYINNIKTPNIQYGRHVNSCGIGLRNGFNRFDRNE